jgi:PAS domain S-box-containing protein
MIPRSNIPMLESEKLFSSLFDKVSAGMCISALNGTLLHANPAFGKMLGYEPSELKGLNLDRFIHSDDRTSHELDRRKLADGLVKNCSRQTRMLHKTGTVIRMDQESYLMSEEKSDQVFVINLLNYAPATGSILHVADENSIEPGDMPVMLRSGSEKSTVANGTEHPATGKQSGKKGSLFTKLIADTDDLIFVVDAGSGNFLDINDAFCRRLGYTFGELLGMKISDIEYSGSAHLLLEEFSKSNKNSFLIQSEHRCKNNSVFPVEISVKFISDNEQKYLVGIARDISHRERSQSTPESDSSERKRVESALKTQREYLEQIMNASSNLIFVKNAKGQYTKVNKAFARIYEVEPSELEGKTDEEFHPDNKETIYFREKDQGVISTLKPAPPYETTLKDSRTGQVRWFQTNKVPLITADGEVEVLGIATDITQRKLVTEALRTKQQYLDQILNASPNMIFVKNWDGVFTMVNKACAELYNTTVDDMLGKSEAHFNINKEEIAFYLEKDREVMVKRQPTAPFEETRTNPQTGEIRWYLVSKVPLISQNGTAEVLTIANDITIGKLAEEEIRKQKNFYETFLNSLPIDFAVLNTSGRYIYCNPNAIHDNELREWIIGKDDFEYCRFRGKDMHIAESRKRMFDQALTERRQTEMEEVLKDNDGNTIYSIKRFFPLFNDDGKLKMMLAFGLNITERREAEVKVKENEHLLQSINANIRDAIFRSSLNRGLIYANQAFIDMFGYGSLEEVMDSPDVMLLNPGMRKDLVKEISRSGQVLNKEVLLTKKDGSRFWGLLNVIRTIGDDKDVIFDGALVDISDLKKTEELLTVKNTELEKANAELDSFVYCASHDLRAPLSSLLGLITVAEAEARGMQQEYLKMMKGSVNKLDSFVHDIINYYRNKTMDVHCKRINLKALVNDVVENLKYVTGVERIVFTIDANEDQPFYSDSLRLNLVFNNLISNAIKYHNFKQDAPVIRIHAEISEKKASIAIEDNGLGMANEHLDKIFDMFYRASSTNNGSGLGLYIVKETVTKLNGQVSVKSNLGSGTCFSIEVPNNIKI